MNRLSALILPALPLCLAACSSPGSYPSLAKREAERVTGTALPAEPDAVPSPPLPVPAEITARVEQLVGQARQAHGEFEAGQADTQRRIAAAEGAVVASEGWVSAELAYAELEAARSSAVTALSEIDQLYADERVGHPWIVTPAAELLADAREQLMALVGEENEFLNTLAQQLDSATSFPREEEGPAQVSAD